MKKKWSKPKVTDLGDTDKAYYSGFERGFLIALAFVVLCAVVGAVINGIVN